MSLVNARAAFETAIMNAVNDEAPTVPIEFVQSTEESGFQENVARLYITADLIGDNQPLLQDEVTLTFSGSTRGAKITDIRTLKGGQEYLFRIDVIF